MIFTVVENEKLINIGYRYLRRSKSSFKKKTERSFQVNQVARNLRAKKLS